MSQRAESNNRLALYHEISDVVSAMKNLAQVELHRSTNTQRFISAAFENVVNAMSALHSAFPGIFDLNSGKSVLLLLGTERGFCGGFNEQLARFVLTQDLSAYHEILCVGSRLNSKLKTESRHDLQQPLISHTFAGPATTDEIMPCVQGITDYFIASGMPHQLELLCHTQHNVELIQLLPKPISATDTNTCSNLQLNISKADLGIALQWQCLSQGLAYYLASSLEFENRFRLQQMEGARNHLQELMQNLQLRINTLRQQEIVDEIEVMLSLESH